MSDVGIFHNQQFLAELFKKATRDIELFGGNRLLVNNILLRADRFLSTSNLFAWHNNGVSDFSGVNWNGGQNLVESGTGLTASTNHLGDVSFNKFNGSNDFLRNTDPTFDTQDEDFTFFAWVKPDAIGAIRSIASKYETNANNRSWDFKILTNGNLQFSISADGITDQNLTIKNMNNVLLDGKPHFVACVYTKDSGDATNGIMLVMVDDVVVGYIKNSVIFNTRFNDANSELKIGASSIASTPDQFWDGDIMEMGYRKAALSVNALRKIYSAGSGKYVTEDRDSLVYIEGKRRVSLKINPAGIITLQNITPYANGTPSGWSIWVPEDGDNYVLHSLGKVSCIDDDNDDDCIVEYKLKNIDTVVDLTPLLREGFTNFQNTAGDPSTQGLFNVNTKKLFFSLNDELQLQTILQSANTDSYNIEQGQFTLEKD